VLPTLFGEKIVLRLLDKDKLMLDMTKLGFEQESLTKFEAAILRPWGWCSSPDRPAAADEHPLLVDREDEHAGKPTS